MTAPIQPVASSPLPPWLQGLLGWAQSRRDVAGINANQRPPEMWPAGGVSGAAHSPTDIVAPVRADALPARPSFEQRVRGQITGTPAQAAASTQTRLPEQVGQFGNLTPLSVDDVIGGLTGMTKHARTTSERVQNAASLALMFLPGALAEMRGLKAAGDAAPAIDALRGLSDAELARTPFGRAPAFEESGLNPKYVSEPSRWRTTPAQDDMYARFLARREQRLGPPGGLPAILGDERGALMPESYGGQHSPPRPDGGAPLHDLTGAGTIYPDDVYGPNAVRYYGTGDEALDRQTFALAQSLKGKPNAQVTIYRAIPDDLTAADKIAKIEKQKAYILKYGKVPSTVETHLSSSQYYDQISSDLERLRAQPADAPEGPVGVNRGDWVTINRAYAKQHGESALRGNYKIISKKVKAHEIFTNGDSIHEFGYWPGGSENKGSAATQMLAGTGAAAGAALTGGLALENHIRKQIGPPPKP